MEAAQEGHLDLVRYLLKAGQSSLQLQYAKWFEIYFFFFLKYMYKSCILWFLGANVHATTGTGDTALTYACENGHTDVAEALLEHGAELVIIFRIEI